MTANAAHTDHALAATWWRDANTPGATAPHLVAQWRCSCGVTGAVSEGKSPKAKMAAALAEHAEHAEDAATPESVTQPLDGEAFRHAAGYAGHPDVAIEVLELLDNGQSATVRFLEADRGRGIPKGDVRTVSTFFLL